MKRYQKYVMATCLIVVALYGVLRVLSWYRSSFIAQYRVHSYERCTHIETNLPVFRVYGGTGATGDEGTTTYFDERGTLLYRYSFGFGGYTYDDTRKDTPYVQDVAGVWQEKIKNCLKIEASAVPVGVRSSAESGTWER